MSEPIEPIHDPESDRFREACRRFNAANSEDPNLELDNGATVPRELAYARRLSQWVLNLAPNASESLCLAAHCQHIRRWAIPRDSQPPTKAGYLKWRAQLKEFHAETAARILRETGYPEDIIQRVKDLNLKRNFPADRESRILEDALCLVFLQHQLAGLARKMEKPKLINALRKSWSKMTEQGRQAAMLLEYGEVERQLLTEALRDLQTKGVAAEATEAE